MIVLVVDDIALNRKLLRALLEAEEYTTLEAADGAKALAMLRETQVDAVISDVLMPHMDGFGLCQEIRRTPGLEGLAFILYTATYKSPEDIKLAHTIGADRYLTKPAPKEAILGALREALEIRASRVVVNASAPKETQVLQEYNQVLFNKLEEKNTELERTMTGLHKALEQIMELNGDLERRVQERTNELEQTNTDLRKSFAEVKELSGLLPICCYCKKIRDDKNYWQSVEGYITHHSKARFSHGYCPDCYQTIVLPQLAEFR